MKSNTKIGLIVEGDSDELFFNKYFKPRFIKNLHVRTSGINGTCKILRNESIVAHIKALRLQGCSKIIILIDLDTQCDGVTHDCVVRLKTWYKSKIRISNDDDIVVSVSSKEIESWMLSAWETSDRKGKEEFKRKFELESKKKKTLNEKELFQKFISSKRDINHENNKSLCYFMNKLGLVKSCK